MVFGYTKIPSHMDWELFANCNCREDYASLSSESSGAFLITLRRP